MKILKYFTLALSLAIIFSACKKDNDEITLTPDGEVAIDNSLIGVWKLTYDDYSIYDAEEENDGTEGEITITITADGTIISENEYIHYDWEQVWSDTVDNGWGGWIGVLDQHQDYEILKFESINIASNRMKINGLPFYWSVYEDDNDDEIIYLDVTDTYNDVGGMQDEYTIFPNTEFVKQ